MLATDQVAVGDSERIFTGGAGRVPAVRDRLEQDPAGRVQGTARAQRSTKDVHLQVLQK